MLAVTKMMMMLLLMIISAPCFLALTVRLCRCINIIYVYHCMSHCISHCTSHCTSHCMSHCMSLHVTACHCMSLPVATCHVYDTLYHMYACALCPVPCVSDLDHLVQLVGYGSEHGKDYWWVGGWLGEWTTGWLDG